MLDQFVRDELNKFAKYVIQQARTNLTKGTKNVSRDLYESLDFNIEEVNGKTSLSFEMEDYGKFQDKGVSGTEKKYNTPYKYTNKMPPTRVFDKWVIRKGIAPRGTGGAFAKRQSLKFLIARSIYKKGIRPSLFFTKPFEAAFKRLPDDLVKAYSIGIEKMIQVNIQKQ